MAIEVKGKIVIWRDKIDNNAVNIGSQSGLGQITCWGQVHIDAFWEWFRPDGDDYSKILEKARDDSVVLETTFIVN